MAINRANGSRLEKRDGPIRRIRFLILIQPDTRGTGLLAAALPTRQSVRRTFWLRQLPCPRNRRVVLNAALLLALCLIIFGMPGPTFRLHRLSFSFVNSQEIFLFAVHDCHYKVVHDPLYSSERQSISYAETRVKVALSSECYTLMASHRSRMTSRRNEKGTRKFSYILLLGISSSFLFLLRLLEHHLSLDPPLCQ